ncbi:MAG: hypothetical protein IT323_07425, partial [Anaerolineae bacterium]|nr:hypothetical protein [Anaerolineae bacterium]
MRALRRLAAFGLIVLLLAVTFDTRAQEQPACPDLVARALALTSERCLDLGRDEVCYGNIKLTLDPREGVDQASIQFEQPGDRIALASVASLKLGALDEQSDEWGVAYMRMRANLPDVAGGQFVTMLMFGDTEIRDASVELSEARGQDYAPMQAFYFRTGVGGGQSGILDACRGLPTDGVLIQTPKGAGEIQLVANEVDLTLGSTVLLEAPGQPETLGDLQTPTGFEEGDSEFPQMTITTFEGGAEVGALGQTQFVGPGQQVTVPLDQDSRPSGPPNNPQYTGLNQYQGLTDLITGAGDENLIDMRDPDPTATLEPSATPTASPIPPSPIPPTRVPATAAPTATYTPVPPPPPAPTAVPTSIFAVAGDGQSVPAGGASGQLGAKVVDANGNPVGYVTVHFEIFSFSEGPSAVFTGTGSTTENVITQADGIAYSSPLQVGGGTGPIEISANETYFGFATTFTVNVVPGSPSQVEGWYGDGQSALVGTDFGQPLAVWVGDAFGNGVPGVVVNFTAPGSGPSGSFAGSGTNTISVPTDGSGMATTPTFTANTEAGQYTVTADAPGLGSVNFTLENLSDQAWTIVPEGGGGQAATVGAGYASSLRVSVRDQYGNLATGAAVTFSAPGSGPSAVFSGS